MILGMSIPVSNTRLTISDAEIEKKRMSLHSHCKADYVVDAAYICEVISSVNRAWSCANAWHGGNLLPRIFGKFATSDVHFS